MQCLNPSVLERQISQCQQQQQQQQQGFSIETLLSLHNEGFGTNGWPTATNTDQYPLEISAVSGSEKSTKKRKAAEKQVGSDGNEKRMKATSADSSPKEELKKKQDYIHVRARRGQATDSHSLAERVRRERISERMKYLQGLVPGCNKITGKAGMLDEIINYVQSLQRQVEFLSMKLAAVNPRLDFNMENFFSKEMNLACNLISAVGMSSELIDPAFLQFNHPLQQAAAAADSCGIDMAMDPAEIALRRTMSAPASTAPETILDSCFNVNQASSGWENELQRLYGVELSLQGRGTAFPFQSLLQGNLLPNNLKMEM